LFRASFDNIIVSEKEKKLTIIDKTKNNDGSPLLRRTNNQRLIEVPTEAFQSMAVLQKIE